MITKLIAMIALVFGPSPDKLPPGTVYIPPATSGKGAKVVVLPKKLFPNPLDKVPIDTPPEFFFPPIEIDPPVTQVQDTFSIPSAELEEPVVISAP